MTLPAALTRTKTRSPDTARSPADAAMILATTTGNRVHGQSLVPVVSAPDIDPRVECAEETWEAEGGHLARIPA